MWAQFDASLWYTDVLESGNILVHIRKTCLSRLLFLIGHQYSSGVWLRVASRTYIKRAHNQKRMDCRFKIWQSF